MTEPDPIDVSTCQLSDALDRLGLPPLGLPGIWPLEPARPIVGRALTVLFRPKQEVDPQDRVEYLEHVGRGHVIVIDNGGRIDCSSWGGQRSLAARQRGAVGVVLHGAYRDVAEQRAAGFPVYGVGRTVAGSRHGGVPVAVGVPLTIGDCSVHQGDVVVGDESGVIVVPADRYDDVLAEARRVAAEETQVSAGMARGEDFLAYRAQVRSRA